MDGWDFDPAVDAAAFAKLGYAASSAGIARRQREFKEGWWAHAERSKAFILNAAKRTRRQGLAVVLGAGKAYDLPLEELARSFERLVLVDIDAEALAATRAAVIRDPALQKKVAIHAMDLTGVSAQMVAAIEGDASESGFLSLCNAYRLNQPPRLVPGTDKADLLVSALVLTQLALPAKLYARDRFVQAHGELPRDGEPAWVKAFDALDLRMQQDHLDALTAHAGLAVLISEVRHHVTGYVPGKADRPTGVSWPLVGDAPLEKRLPAGMEVVSLSQWNWPRIRATAKAPGALMDVSALVVRARNS